MVSGIPSRADLMRYEPRWLSVPEVNFTDHWLARWIKNEPMPKNAPVTYAYAIAVHEERGYGVRRKGDNGKFSAIEGDVPAGEKPEAWLKREVKERIGGTVGKAELAGYLVCKATSHNPEVPAGTLAVRPVWIAVLKAVKDTGPGGEWERRRYPLNEYATLLRDQYVILAPYMREALDRYLVMRAKGEA